MRPKVNHEIGTWLLEYQDGKQSMAIIRDLDAFMTAYGMMINQKRIKGWQDGIEQLIDQIEFAKVVVQKNGMVKWDGHFVESA